METDKNPMPRFEFGIVRRCKAIARFIIGTETPLYMSDHYNPEHFKEETNIQQQFDFTEAEQLTVRQQNVQDLILQARIAREARS